MLGHLVPYPGLLSQEIFTTLAEATIPAFFLLNILQTVSDNNNRGEYKILNMIFDFFHSDFRSVLV